MHVQTAAVQFHLLVGDLTEIEYSAEGNPVFGPFCRSCLDQLIGIDLFAKFSMLNDRQSRNRRSGKSEMQAKLFSADRGGRVNEDFTAVYKLRVHKSGEIRGQIVKPSEIRAVVTSPGIDCRYFSAGVLAVHQRTIVAGCDFSRRHIIGDEIACDIPHAVAVVFVRLLQQRVEQAHHVRNGLVFNR